MWSCSQPCDDLSKYSSLSSCFLEDKNMILNARVLNVVYCLSHSLLILKPLNILFCLEGHKMLKIKVLVLSAAYCNFICIYSPEHNQEQTLSTTGCCPQIKTEQEIE